MYIRESLPKATFRIVGRSPSARVRALGRVPGVVVVGGVANLHDEVGSATVSVAPMQSGSGMQNKILEAMAVGTPVVATTLGRGDIEAESMRHMVVADAALDFARAVADLLSDPSRQLAIGSEGRELVCSRYAWNHHATSILDLYQTVRDRSRQNLEG